MIAPKTSRRQLAWELTLYCLTRSKRLHQESKADSTSLSRVMAAVANQVHSTAQQIGARIGWNPIDAATQPPTGTRERVLNLSDPRTDHRNLGFEDSCLSGAPTPAVLGRSLMMAAIGSVLAMPAAGWLINKFGSLNIVIGSTLGFGLALPLIAESNTVLTLSVALLFYGAMAGSMDVAMNTHAVMLEKRYQRHIMSSFHALFSLGGMAGSALGGLVAPRAVPAGIHFWVSGIALTAMSILAFRWLALPSAPKAAEKVASGGTITWSVPLGALALLAFSIMLVEGAIADWSAIYLRTSVLTGPGLAALGYAVFSGAMAGGRLTGDYFTGELGRGHLVCYGALLAAAGLVFVLLFGNAGWALVGFTCAGAGLATIIPNTFAAAGNIEGSAPGPSLAVVTTAGYVGFLAGPPLIGFVAQLSTVRAALWILVVLSGLSAFASTSMKRTSPLKKIP